ncbi:hypothetical protein ACH9EU_08535 [Kocuria sp. M1R5S2]|uniref:hypothetical protein n=1 Tax=Kocuria rhizosphaerae TaxID=3376285 RepID=UPI00378A73B4
MTRLIITVIRTVIILIFLIGAYHWITHRDWLLLALGSWGTIGLLLLINIDRRDPDDAP